MIYDPVVFWFLVVWAYCCFMMLEKIRARRGEYPQWLERLLYFATLFFGPVVILILALQRGQRDLLLKLQLCLDVANERAMPKLQFSDPGGDPLFQNIGSLQGEEKMVLYWIFNEFLEQRSTQLTLSPKPNGSCLAEIAVNGKILPIYEMNQFIADALIGDLKSASGADPMIFTRPQQGEFNLAGTGDKCGLLLSTQPGFGGEKIRIDRTGFIVPAATEEAEEDKL